MIRRAAFTITAIALACVARSETLLGEGTAKKDGMPNIFARPWRNTELFSRLADNPLGRRWRWLGVGPRLQGSRAMDKGHLHVQHADPKPGT